MVGDYLADLVEAGEISDWDALLYVAGDREARRKVSECVEREMKEYEW